MAWDNLEKIFPQGVMVNTDNQFLSINDIREQQLPAVSSLLSYNARDMIYKQDEWGWSKDGTFLICNVFDITQTMPHLNMILPLNVYGMTMLDNYAYLNDIDIDSLTEDFIMRQ